MCEPTYTTITDLKIYRHRTPHKYKIVYYILTGPNGFLTDLNKTTL